MCWMLVAYNRWKIDEQNRSYNGCECVQRGLCVVLLYECLIYIICNILPSILTCSMSSVVSLYNQCCLQPLMFNVSLFPLFSCLLYDILLRCCGMLFTIFTTIIDITLVDLTGKE